MRQYAIYCTQEQIRKALELGAPIEVYDNWDSDDIREANIFYKEKYIELDDYKLANRITAEEMIGWLEDQELIHEIDVNRGIHSWYFDIGYTMRRDDSSDESFNSRKEATLSAISTALDYLSKNKRYGIQENTK